MVVVVVSTNTAMTTGAYHDELLCGWFVVVVTFFELCCLSYRIRTTYSSTTLSYERQDFFAVDEIVHTTVVLSRELVEKGDRCDSYRFMYFASKLTDIKKNVFLSRLYLLLRSPEYTTGTVLYRIRKLFFQLRAVGILFLGKIWVHVHFSTSAIFQVSQPGYSYRVESRTGI